MKKWDYLGREDYSAEDFKLTNLWELHLLERYYRERSSMSEKEIQDVIKARPDYIEFCIPLLEAKAKYDEWLALNVGKNCKDYSMLTKSKR